MKSFWIELRNQKFETFDFDKLYLNHFFDFLSGFFVAAISINAAVCFSLIPAVIRLTIGYAFSLQLLCYYQIIQLIT